MNRITEAIEKITNEVNADKSQMIQPIGEYLVDTMTKATAEKILTAGKTVSGCFKHLYEIANKNQKNRSYCFTSPAEVDNYFGITPEDKAASRITSIAPKPAAGALNVNLFDLL